MVVIDPATLNTMPVNGYDVPLADLSDVQEPPRVVFISGNPYIFYRSYLRKGYGALLPRDIETLIGQGKTHILIGERGDRLYLYLLDTDLQKK